MKNMLKTMEAVKKLNSTPENKAKVARFIFFF
jgi:hypothetical protein